MALRPPAVGGPVLVPDAPQLATGVIDVRDLSEWLVRCAEQHVSGIFNAMADAIPFPAHLDAARQAAGSSAAVVAAPEEWLLAHDVREWSGPRSMPLWLADTSRYGMNSRSIDRAKAAGLTHRPLINTLRDSLEWRLSLPVSDHRGAGLSDDDEEELQAAFSADEAMTARRL